MKRDGRPLYSAEAEFGLLSLAEAAQVLRDWLRGSDGAAGAGSPTAPPPPTPAPRSRSGCRHGRADRPARRAPAAAADRIVEVVRSSEPALYNTLDAKSRFFMLLNRILPRRLRDEILREVEEARRLGIRMDHYTATLTTTQ